VERVEGAEFCEVVVLPGLKSVGLLEAGRRARIERREVLTCCEGHRTAADPLPAMSDRASSFGDDRTIDPTLCDEMAPVRVNARRRKSGR